MNYILSSYEPANVLKYFEDICAIPHGSGNEKGIADYIDAFAKKRGLFTLRDEAGNIFVRKNATEGYEDKEPILFQGHMDMVCEKNADSLHDFTTDGLKLIVKDGYLYADNTTLGADDGVAVAMMLALLDTDKHPTLECLFTVEEETGLAGAMGFDCSSVISRRMINLDSEEESSVTCGCAGGMRTEIDLPAITSDCPDKKGIKISLKGLCGGHSGMDIGSGKSNAIILMGRLLSKAFETESFGIADISGGGKDNAIARECFVTITAGKDPLGLIKAVKEEEGRIARELSQLDSGFNVTIEECEINRATDACVTEKLISLLLCVKTGVLKMSNHIDGLVEFSRNLGIISLEKDHIRLVLSTRSSVEAQLDLAQKELDALSALASSACRHYARYPGWEYEPKSPLRDKYASAYKALYGKDVEIAIIHAGLECGILSSKMPGIDIISIGANTFDIHSPDEHLELASVERVWKLLLEIVRE